VTSASRKPGYGAVEAQIAETTRGPVEYAVLGRGHPVVVLHGSPGGIDSAALMAGFLPRDEIAALVWSRPGYLGTPLAGRETIDEQADLAVALLDSLGLERAGVLSWSGGGPVGYRLAARFPDRVTSLVAFAAVSQAYAMPPSGLGERLVFTTNAGQWLLRLLATHQPRQYVSGALAAEGSLTKEQLSRRVEEVLADDVKRNFVLALGPTAGRDRLRRDGFRNDLAQFAVLESLALESIRVPTLLVHGDADTDVPPEHSAEASARIPGAELLTLHTGTHLALFTHPEAAAAQARAVQMLLRH
jgi:pimeloyl-ACP methyl ester carboxylesterase